MSEVAAARSHNAWGRRLPEQESGDDQSGERLNAWGQTATNESAATARPNPWGTSSTTNGD